MYCDFCNATNPEWLYIADEFSGGFIDAESHNLVNNTILKFDSNWAACDACMHDIEADKWDSILDRYFTNLTPAEKRRFSRLKSYVATLHETFRVAKKSYKPIKLQ